MNDYESIIKYIDDTDINSLFCPYYYTNEYGVENIHFGDIVISKFCKVLFFPRKYELTVKNKIINLPNSDIKKIFNHTKNKFAKLKKHL